MSLISISSAEQKLKSQLHDESRESNVHQPDTIWNGCFHPLLSALTLVVKGKTCDLEVCCLHKLRLA